MCQTGRAWIELSRANLSHNVRELQGILPGHTKIMAVVKANAYGHGAVLIGKALQDLGISDFCVATVQEGIALRQSGITGQILVLGYTHPSLFAELSHYNLVQTVIDHTYAQILSAYGKTLSVHVGIDTGMRRLGERSDALDDILSIWKLPHLKITGLFSHFCVSDGSTPEDRLFTLTQLERFQTVAKALRLKGFPPFKTHIQGSYGVLNYPTLSFDYARIGIALYGALSHPNDRIQVHPRLKPVLTLKARVSCVKILYAGETLGYGRTFSCSTDRKIAIISIGYADGVPRNSLQQRYVLIHGKKAPIIGRICMDQLSVDVSAIPSVSPGDEAVLIGHSGGQQITVCEVAGQVGTISNEILSRLGNRLDRFERE